MSASITHHSFTPGLKPNLSNKSFSPQTAAIHRTAFMAFGTFSWISCVLIGFIIWFFFVVDQFLLRASDEAVLERIRLRCTRRSVHYSQGRCASRRCYELTSASSCIVLRLRSLLSCAEPGSNCRVLEDTVVNPF